MRDCEKKEEQMFQVGDVVEAWGVRGKVAKQTPSHDYPILVEFENGNWSTFIFDGKYYQWHKTPSLKLIERQKKKVKVTRKSWANIYDDGKGYVYPKKEEAERMANTDSRIACVEIEYSFEREE